MIITFMVYNSIRNILNLPIHFILVTIRFSSIPLLFSTAIPVLPTFYLILLFPLINTLERCGELRFNLNWFQNRLLNNTKNGRYYYYAILAILSLIIIASKIYFKKEYYIDIIFLGYSLYFMAYRYTSYHYAQNKIEVFPFVNKERR